MMKNPAWQRDELILALDLYFSNSFDSLSAKHSKIQELSEILGKLSIFDAADRTTTFRNPQGVYMKLGHFLGIDPTDPRRGLRGHGKLDTIVFKDYVERRQELAVLAETIRQTICDEILTRQLVSISDSDEEELSVVEGRTIFRLHKYRERERKIVEKKKLTVLKLHGKLDCEVCGFDFEATYGDLGRGFAECHHITPISMMNLYNMTTLRDLAIVCANCHRMLHRKLNMSIETLRKQIL